MHVPPTKVFPQLTVNKTTPRCSDGCPVPIRGFFPNVIKFRIATPTISEKAIRFRHPDYNPDQTQKLTSSSMSRHLSTRNISSKSMHTFLSNLANRQTDRQTRAKTFTSAFVGGNKLVLVSDTQQTYQQQMLTRGL